MATLFVRQASHLSLRVQRGACPRACPGLVQGFAVQVRRASTAEKFGAVEAVLRVKDTARAKFDETVEIAVRLGVDPRKPNQNVRSTTQLPHGTGKTVRVAVFCQHDAQVEEAIAAGADIAGSEELIANVQKGNIDFDRCIATPDMMAKLGKIARVRSLALRDVLGLLLCATVNCTDQLTHRLTTAPRRSPSCTICTQILGPRGLMPNPKLGSVTKDLDKGVRALKGGQVQFRTEKNGIIHAGIGKVSFSDEALVENLRAFMVALSNSKPEGQKGKYIVGAHLTSTMGPSHELNVALIDPASPRFMQEQNQEQR